MILLVFLLLSSFVYAQNGSKKFGDVSIEELKFEKYDKDTAAAALILFKKGNLEVDKFSTKGWRLERHFRIKILDKSAINEWGNVNFTFPKYGLKDLKGASYNLENGQIVKSELQESSIFKSKYDKYTDEVRFALPNVKEGTVLEFSFTERHGRFYFPRWKFQHSIPTLYSEYSFYYSSDFVPYIRGPFEVIQEEKKYEGNFQKWVMEDVPAFRAEPMMPDSKAFLSAIEFDLKTSSWEDIFFRFRGNEHFADIVYGPKYVNLEKIAKDLTAGLTEPEEKIKAISDYIKESISWNGENAYLADDPRLVLKEKKGDSGDINVILATILEKAGFDVSLVLLSTRDNGFVFADYPWHGYFNYVICELKLNGERLLLDATEKHLPYDMLPVRCLNHKGFLIGKEQYGWIEIEPKKHDKVSLSADLTLKETGEMDGSLKLIMSDYAAYKLRRKTFGSSEGENENQLNDELKGLGNLTLLGKENLRDLDKPVIEKYKLDNNPYATAAGDLLYFNPHIFLREEQNPFKLPERLYPMDYELMEEKVLLTKINIPEEFMVEELPESAAFVLPGNAAKFVCSISHSGNEILVMNSLKLNKTLFQPVEYLELKELFDKIIAKQSENVVLRRK